MKPEELLRERLISAMKNVFGSDQRRIAHTLKALEHVCTIVGNHHSAKGLDTPEFRIVWDADWLVNIPGDFADLSRSKLESLIERVFKTKTGNAKAGGLFLDRQTGSGENGLDPGCGGAP